MRALIAVVTVLGALMALIQLACNDPDYQGGGRSMTFPSNIDSGGGDTGVDTGSIEDTGVDMGEPIEDTGSDVDAGTTGPMDAGIE